MKDRSDPEISEMIESAREELEDAERLGRTAGGRMVAGNSASAGAENYMRALATSNGRQVHLMWDIAKVYEAVKDLGGLAEETEAIRRLAESSMPRKDGSGTGFGGLLLAARRIECAVLVAFGEELPELPTLDPITDTGAVQKSLDENQASIYDEVQPNYEPPSYKDVSDMTLPMNPSGNTAYRESQPARQDRQNDYRLGRSDNERQSSFVKTFLVCPRCGVRLPMKRQTAKGNVPCPHCGRPMEAQR